MRISVAEPVLAMFPDLYCAGVRARRDDVAGRTVPHQVTVRRTPRFDDATQAARREVWREAYRRMGLRPNRVRPPMEALKRLADRPGGLRPINPLVDAYNTISLNHVMPLGGYDCARLTGGVHLTTAAGGETFQPISSDGSAETVESGEIVYRDSRCILTRRWNHRDTALTRISEDTADVLIMAETPRTGAVPAAGVDEAIEEVSSVLHRWGWHTVQFGVDGHCPAVDVPIVGS